MTSDVQKLNKTAVKKNRFGGYSLKKKSSKDIIIQMFFLMIALVSIYYVFSIEYKWELFTPRTGMYILQKLFRYDLVSSSDMWMMADRILNTVLLGLLSTFVGAIIGFPLGLLAATNISNKKLANLIKALASVMRAIPTIVWVLIFVAGYGLTATTAIIGMSFHSISFFIKSYSESFEEVDEGVIEALRAAGASTIQIITGAIIPATLTKIIAWFAMRVEINFAVAVVIGPAVGVPGTIGTLINVYSNQALYSEMGFAILLTFLVAFLFEILITRMKNKKLVK